MRTGTTVFHLGLGLAWLLIAAVTLWAVWRMGLGTVVPSFIAGYAHPWQAQFNTDLALHTLLAAAWIVYRSRSKAAGLLCGVCAVFLGALFTLPYVLAASIRARGDMRRLLLGSRA